MNGKPLDQPIYRRTVATVPDGVGGSDTTESWTGPLWAHVEAIRSQERIIADQASGVTSYRVTVRNSGDAAAISTNDVLRWGGVEMNVRAAPNAGRAVYRTLEAETGVPNR